MIGPLARSRTPSGVQATHRMIHPRRAIPRRAKIPFHIGIEDKKLAILIKGRVKLVAKTISNHLDLFGVRIGFQHKSSRRQFTAGVSITIPHPRKKVVLTPRFCRAGAVNLLGLVGMISKNKMQRLTIRTRNNTVQAMLSSALEFTKEFLFIKLAVIVGIAKSIKATRTLLLVLQKIECTINIAEPVRSLDLGV